MEFTIVPFTPGTAPNAARAYSKRFKYGTTGGPTPGFYEALHLALTGTDPTDTPTIDETQTVADTLATVDLTTTCCTATADGAVGSVTYTADAGITGAASPASRTLSLVNTGTDGTGTTVLATLALVSGVNCTMSVAKVIPVTTDPILATVGKGDIIKWKSVHVGATGLVDPGGDVDITFIEP